MSELGNYDGWKCREPDPCPQGCYECSDDEDETERFHREDDRDRCVLGDECCCPHPFHTSAECFSAEMMEAYFADEAGGEG